MASKKKPPQPRQQLNNSAPASPGSSAEATGTGATPVASASSPSATETGSSTSTAQGTPPAGGAPGADQANENKGESNSGGTQSEEKKGNVVKSLIVSAKTEGFRRAGRAWSKAETTVDADNLTEEQVEALLAEPMLNVAVVPE